MDSVSVSASASASASRANRVRTNSGAKGLVNEPGSNNCFLNSAVQVLWHLDAFRRNFRQLSAHRCTRDSCIFCALKVVFTQLEYSDHAQIAPDQLRKALAACTSYLPADDDVNNSSTFALGSMADACECLENILLRLHAHLDYSPHGSTACYAHHCLTHAKFAMRVSESVECSVCAARGTPSEYAQLVYYVATHAILTNVRSSSDAYGIPDAFGRALKAAASGDERECPAACGQQRLPLLRRLISAPDVLGVGLVWNSASPGASTLTTLYESISTSLRVQDLFDATPDAQLVPYQLVGLVCFVGRHYATFMLHSRAGSWILFDDSNVKEIGRSWHLVVARCLKCRFVPVLLLYANPQAVPIDADCVPQNTVQISNAQLLCAVDPSPTSSLSRRRHERTGSNNTNSPERGTRTHKKTRAAVGVFQARVRNAASVDNLHQPEPDNNDEARNHRQASLAFALGFTDRTVTNKSTVPLRPRTVTRRDSHRAGRTAETEGPLKRHKSLENMLDGSLRDDESDSSSVSSFNLHGRQLAQTNEQTVDPKAIEALGFRWQFSDLIAKADILLRDAAACEQEADYTDALLRFTQAAICLKQASDLPAIEQNSRLAAVSRQNLCNASIKRLHRQLNHLASAATRNTLPGSDGDSSVSPVAGANRQDSGISTWSEGDPSGHSTASEDFSTAANGNRYADKPTYAETLTRLGPYSTLPRKPKLRQLNSVTSSDADTDLDRDRQHQYSPAAQVPQPVLRADSVPVDLTLSPPVVAQSQPVVLAVRSARRATRNDEPHTTSTSSLPVKILPPTQQLNTPIKSATTSQPTAADIRQRLELLRPSQVTAIRHVTPLNAPADRSQAAVSQLNPTAVAFSRNVQPGHNPETEANQTHAIVARSVGHKPVQPNRTPQMVRKVIDLNQNSSGTLAQSPQPQLNASPVVLNNWQTSSAPTSAVNEQRNSWQNSTQPLAQTETPMTGLRPSTVRRMAKKKVTFLDDLIEKQAERVRHNMAQLVSSRNTHPPAENNHKQQCDTIANSNRHSNVALRAVANSRVKVLTANDSLSRLPINSTNEDFSDSSLTSSNSNSTRNSAQKSNVHRFTSAQNAQKLGYSMQSGHDADSETDSSIVSWNGNGRPIGNASHLCQLCQYNSTEQPDSYCSACAAYMSKLL